MAAHPLLHILPRSPLPKSASPPLPAGRCLLPPSPGHMHSLTRSFTVVRLLLPTEPSPPHPPWSHQGHAGPGVRVGRWGQAILTHWRPYCMPGPVVRLPGHSPEPQGPPLGCAQRKEVRPGGHTRHGRKPALEVLRSPGGAFWPRFAHLSHEKNSVCRPHPAG